MINKHCKKISSRLSKKSRYDVTNVKEAIGFKIEADKVYQKGMTDEMKAKLESRKSR